MIYESHYQCHGQLWSVKTESPQKGYACPKCDKALEPDRTTISVDVLVAARNASGSPDFFGPVTVTLDELAYLEGEHYDEAIAQADEAGYEGPVLPFDENEFSALERAMGAIKPRLQPAL